MALICMSQGRHQRPDPSIAAVAAALADRHHHHHPKGRREASPSTRNRVQPLSEVVDGDTEADHPHHPVEQIVYGIEGPEEKEELVREEEEAADMAAEQPEDCDSGCECEPEEAEGKNIFLDNIP